MTTFKIGSEYVISTILLASAFLLWRSRAKFDPVVFRLLLSAIIITIASEMTFTLYTDVYGIANAVGHYLKIISFYLIYKAIVEVGLTKPYAILFKDLKDKEEILQKSEVRYRDLVNNIPDAIFSSVPDENTSIVFMSDRWQEWTGCPPELLYQDPQVWQESVLPEDREAAVKHYMEGVRQGREYTLEYRVVHKDSGQIRYLYEHVVPVIDREGNIVRLDGIITDITERKKLEKVLRESEELHRCIVNLSGEVGEAVIMLQDTDQGEGIQTFVSDEWLHITGYSREELIGGSFLNLVHPKDRKASQERHRSKIKGEVIPGLFEMTIIRKDGTGVPVELTGAHTTYRGGHANIAYIRDVTVRKEAEAKTQQFITELQ